MSRIGRRPIGIPDKVKMELKAGLVSVSGPLGSLLQTLPEGVTLEINSEGTQAVVQPPKPNRHNAGFQGLTRALVANMVEGVTKGYSKGLEINGVGYKAELRGDTLICTLGFSHTKSLQIPNHIKAEVSKSQTEITISGIDKQLVGQVAAQIRSFKIPEPYKAKGVKYKGEVLRRKAGKAGAK